MSTQEGPVKRRRRACPRIPFILNDKTLVYGCDHCMKQHNPKLIHWLLLGKALGLPRDLRELVAGKIGANYVNFEDWIPSNGTRLAVCVKKLHMFRKWIVLSNSEAPFLRSMVFAGNRVSVNVVKSARFSITFVPVGCSEKIILQTYDTYIK